VAGIRLYFATVESLVLMLAVNGAPGNPDIADLIAIGGIH
jgi:hypothetical protein